MLPFAVENGAHGQTIKSYVFTSAAAASANPIRPKLLDSMRRIEEANVDPNRWMQDERFRSPDCVRLFHTCLPRAKGDSQKDEALERYERVLERFIRRRHVAVVLLLGRRRRCFPSAVILQSHRHLTRGPLRLSSGRAFHIEDSDQYCR
ncbi:hypothetical protein ACLOJK_010645 [Asimina triloba]